MTGQVGGGNDGRSAAVTAELLELRRGRGVLADDIQARLGPLLAEFCEVAPSDDVAIVRTKVSNVLLALSERLHGDLQSAVRFGLGLGGDVPGRFLKDRMDALAQRLHRDPRTAIRRLDEGLRRLAEIIVNESSEPAREPNEFAPDGWYVALLRTNVLLDRSPPQVIEHRSIVATATGLETLLASMTAPDSTDQDGPSVHGEVMHGGVLVGEEHVPGGHYLCRVRLPGRLRAGDGHEFALIFTLEPYWYLPPYYVVTPFRRYDRFELNVRFGHSASPERTWRLNGVPPSLIEGFAAEAEARSVDPVGEVRLGFSGLRPGLSYGLRWQPKQLPDR